MLSPLGTALALLRWPSAKVAWKQNTGSLRLSSLLRRSYSSAVISPRCQLARSLLIVAHTLAVSSLSRIPLKSSGEQGNIPLTCCTLGAKLQEYILFMIFLF